MRCHGRGDTLVTGLRVFLLMGLRPAGSTKSDFSVPDAQFCPDIGALLRAEDLGCVADHPARDVQVRIPRICGATRLT